MPTVDITAPGGAFTPAAVGDGVTDDGPAFRACNVWAQAQSSPITINLGTGAKTFYIQSSDTALRGNSLTYKVYQPLIVQGSGPTNTILKSNALGHFFMGSSPLKTGNGHYGSVNTWTARVDSVSAGASQVTCKTLAKATQFVANTWAIMCGIDLQGFGFPWNPHYFEFVYITNVNAGTGVITFQSPLANTYLDTWPAYSAGGPGTQPDQGGPATLYALEDTFEMDVIYKDFAVEQTGQTYFSGRSVTFNNVKCISVSGNLGLTPSTNKTVTFIGCDLTQYFMEADKLVERIIFDNTQTGQLLFQSPLDYVEVKNGSNIPSLNGTVRDLAISGGSTIGTIGLGAIAYGRCDSFTSTGSTHTGAIGWSGVSDHGDLSNTGVANDYTMVGGLITVPKTGNTVRWGVPGTRCTFTGRAGAPNFELAPWGPMFTVLAVYDDPSNVYIQTDWPYGGFPSWATNIIVQPCAYVNFDASTTSSVYSINSLKAASAAGRYVPTAYQKLTITGATVGADGPQTDWLPETGGRLVSLTVNVTTPYTGSVGNLKWRPLFGTQGYPLDGVTFSSYTPSFDLRTAGTRIITPSGVTGTAGTDSGLALSKPNLWMNNFMRNMTASSNVTTEYNGNPALGPVFTAEIILDQSNPLPVAVAPLRLRLRA